MIEFWGEEIGPLWETNDCDLWEGRKYSRWDVTWFIM